MFWKKRHTKKGVGTNEEKSSLEPSHHLREETVPLSHSDSSGSLKISYTKKSSGLTLSSLGSEVEKEIQKETVNVDAMDDYGYDFNIFKTWSKSNLMKLSDCNGRTAKCSASKIEVNKAAAITRKELSSNSLRSAFSSSICSLNSLDNPSVECPSISMSNDSDGLLLEQPLDLMNMDFNVSNESQWESKEDNLSIKESKARFATPSRTKNISLNTEESYTTANIKHLSKRKKATIYIKKFSAKAFTLLKENLDNTLEIIWVFIAMHYIHIFWSIIIYLTYLYYTEVNKYPLMIFLSVYLPWYMIPWQRLGGFRTSFLMYRPIFKYITRHFELQCEREAILDPQKQYVFGWHPHGILLLGRLSLYGGLWETLFPGLDCRTLAASPLFWLPPMRDVVLLLGAIDASRKYAENALKKGQSVCVYPGGSKEIFYTDRDTKETKLVLRHRKGFIKLALKFGASLVPVYTFNEKNAFTTVRPRTSFYKILLKTLRVPFFIFWGRWGTMLPHKDTKLAVVVGEPMVIKQNSSPTDEEVENVLNEYILRLNELVERHKHKYAPEETLVIE